MIKMLNTYINYTIFYWYSHL